MSFANLISKAYNREKFFSQNPTKIGQVAEFTFWEHPICGDEVPLIVENSETKELGLSHWYDLPDHDELRDALSLADQIVTMREGR